MTMVKSIPINTCNRVTKYYGGESGAILKRLASNAYYRIWDGNGSEGSTSRECTISNACNGVWEDYRGEGGAITKCIVSDDLYRVTNGYRGEATATPKRTQTNASY